MQASVEPHMIKIVIWNAVKMYIKTFGPLTKETLEQTKQSYLIVNL